MPEDIISNIANRDIARNNKIEERNPTKIISTWEKKPQYQEILEEHVCSIFGKYTQYRCDNIQPNEQINKPEVNINFSAYKFFQ